MTWSRWYATKSYLSSALWIVPLIALVLENVLIRVAFALSSWFEWVPWLGTTLAGATEALNTVETLKCPSGSFASHLNRLRGGG